MKKKIVIVDDNPGDIRHLSNALQPYLNEWEIVRTFVNPLLALVYLMENQVNLIFLDINMAEMDGFKFISLANRGEAEVIFVTNHEDYALRAFEVAALDYLLKPVSQDRLADSMRRVQAHQNPPDNLQLEVLHETYHKLQSSQQNLTRLMINNQQSLVLIKVDEIVWCEAKGAYTKFYKKDGKIEMATKPLKFYEALLANQDFFRLHRSSLVNINLIDVIDKSNMTVQMQNGEILPIAPERLSQFIESFRMNAGRNE